MKRWTDAVLRRAFPLVFALPLALGVVGAHRDTSCRSRADHDRRAARAETDATPLPAAGQSRHPGLNLVRFFR